MLKNTAGQKIGGQLISLSDGTIVTTGTTTVYVTGDAGTQAAGSVGAGACTHEGNGYWTYAPAQAETNYDLVAFTFVNTAAVTGTVQVFTSSSSSDPWATAIPGAYGAGTAGKIVGDNINATISSRASQTSVDTVDDLLDTEVAAIKADTAAILIDTAEIGTAGAGLTALATAANLATVAGYLDTEVGAIKAKTDLIPAAPAAVGDIPTVAAILTTQMTESYRADGAAPTLAQALCEVLAHSGEAAISGTTKTIKKFDGTTTAETFTLNSSTAPTAITRAT